MPAKIEAASSERIEGLILIIRRAQGYSRF
jgi:hypothetical protein